MGFFICDLHNPIAKLHNEQYVGQERMKSFTVFHGQGLSKTDFDQIVQTKGGLLSFNNILSTCTKRQVAFDFVRQTIETSDLVGILFFIKIDPSITSTLFSNVYDVSYFEGEEEILFSMHSVFRIGPMKQINTNKDLWQVDLTLTSDNDPELHVLTEQIRKDTYPDAEEWNRLGMLLIEPGYFDKAQEVYDILLDQIMTDREKPFVCHQLGWVKKDQGEYANAIAYYKKSIEIKNNILSSTDTALAASYNNIGLVYIKMGDYSNALSSHQKALEIYQKTLLPNHPSLATSYNNIGLVYKKLGEYSKALLYYHKDLEICQKKFFLQIILL
ncbi:unnamed protein product [Rotaria sp. Silwood2]|nr:unnamed protein product [Rotaria sp. Silwood2]CAF4293020.1 unnamed protein product [Rotaria sp. Silwood2]